MHEQTRLIYHFVQSIGAKMLAGVVRSGPFLSKSDIIEVIYRLLTRRVYAVQSLSLNTQPNEKAFGSDHLHVLLSIR